MLLGQMKMPAVILEGSDRHGSRLVHVARNRRLRPTLSDAGLVPLRVGACVANWLPARPSPNLSCAPVVGVPQAAPHA